MGMRFTGLLVGLFGLLLASTVVNAADSRPNVVLMMTDDI
jgi:hypothetical protein